MLWILATIACGGLDDQDGDGVTAGRDCDDGDATVGAAQLSWADQDGDGFGDDTIWAQACPSDVGWVGVAGDCDDADATEHPEQSSCNCERGDRPSVAWYVDQDGDGVGEEPAAQLSCGASEGLASLAGDCAPLDPAVYPGAEEIWYDGEDQDCSLDSDYDADQDGYESADYGGMDCDDQAAGTHPGAIEVCDLLQADEDCDGLVNGEDPSSRGWTNWFEDPDGDGYGHGQGISACAPEQGYAALDGDCDEASAEVNPGMEEICGDGVANDCVVTDGECGIHGTGVMDGLPLVELPNTASANVLLDPVDLLGKGQEHFVVASPYEYGGDGYVGQVRLLREGDSYMQDLLTTDSTYSILGSTMVTGDLDADGQTDLILSAVQHYDFEGGVYAPRVFVAMGPLELGGSVDELPIIQDNASGLGTSLAIAGGYLVVNAPSESRSEGGNGAVYLFDSDPGAVSSLIDAAGELSFDGQYYMGSAQVQACDVLGTGEQGLVYGGNFGPAYDSGVIWAESLQDGFSSLSDADLWIRESSSEQLGTNRITCVDGNEDGYPELWVLRPVSGELLAFDAESMQQGQDEAWMRVSGHSGDGYSRVRLTGDHDGDGYVDLVVSDPRANSYGAVSVVYGPLSAGSYTLSENRMSSQPGISLSGELAGSEVGLLVSSGNGRSLYWLNGGPGI